nr:glycoside hydrolase family 64 protein [Kutzneria sp. 744]
MYFYLGSPTSQYFDFIEFTVGAAVFNGNTTRVDAFGLKLAMRLHAHDGYDVQVGEDYQTFQEDRSATFQKFVNEVPAEFKQLAQVQSPYRIPAPGSVAAFQPGGQYANYFTSYAQSVGVNETTQFIFGCANSMAGNPTMCAALNRHTAQLPSSQQQDPSQFYKAAPGNYYAKFWHDHSINHLAYGFPYDDVAGQSSFVSHGNPQWLEVAVGW